MNSQRIRPIAICLFRHGARILVQVEYDSVKQDYFCRPLGGGIEFGEYARDAIIREIREEIGMAITNVQWLYTMENIFTYEGNQGHEIVFVYDAQFVDQALYEQEAINCYEPVLNVNFQAVWKSLDELSDGSVRLVPEGLMELLKPA